MEDLLELLSVGRTGVLPAYLWSLPFLADFRVP